MRAVELMTGLVRAGCYCIGVTRSVGIPDPRSSA